MRGGCAPSLKLLPLARRRWERGTKGVRAGHSIKHILPNLFSLIVVTMVNRHEELRGVFQLKGDVSISVQGYVLFADNQLASYKIASSSRLHRDSVGTYRNDILVAKRPQKLKGKSDLSPNKLRGIQRAFLLR